MADQKISELTALTGANVADDDAIAIVDTSATETKKIVFSELKNALDTATGFVRITGDTMTGALDVQSTITSDGLTVGNATSQNSLFDSVFGSGDANEGIVIVPSSTGKGWVGFNNGNNAGIPAQLTYNFSSSLMELYSSGSLNIQTGAASRLNISSGGDISFYEDTGTTPKFFWDASAERLGIGVTDPSAFLEIKDSTAASQSGSLRLNNDNDVGLSAGVFGSTANTFGAYQANSVFVGTSGTATELLLNNPNASGKIRFATGANGGTERMRIDASGSVGIGVVPETWNSLKALQINSQASVSADASSIQLGANCYYNSGWKYINGAAATNYYQDSGVHVWRTAASGSADTAISWSESMRIDSSGNVGIGTSSPSQKLDVNGSVNIPNDYSYGFGGAGSNTYISGNNASNNLRFNTNGSERMRIDSSGNVGIGTSSPSHPLTSAVNAASSNPLTDGANYALAIQNTDATAGNAVSIAFGHGGYNYTNFISSIRTGTGTDPKGDLIFGGRPSDGGTFVERMRIDSSGNLLVGTSNNTQYNTSTETGSQISDGYIAIARPETVAFFNRLSTDGEIVSFRKNGSTVGSIGNSGSNLILSNGYGSQIKLGNNEIVPTSSGKDLGNPTDRWRDIFLSGGVYLGGTGSANKLDDYEEGGWTPTLPNGGTVGTIVKSSYIKVGNLVNVYCNVYLNPTNNSTQFKVGGLPFAAVSNNHGGGTLSYTGGMETRYWSAPLVDTGSAVYFHRHDASTAVVLNSAFGGVNRQFIMQLTYTLV